MFKSYRCYRRVKLNRFAHGNGKRNALFIGYMSSGRKDVRNNTLLNLYFNFITCKLCSACVIYSSRYFDIHIGKSRRKAVRKSITCNASDNRNYQVIVHTVKINARLFKLFHNLVSHFIAYERKHAHVFIKPKLNYSRL